jgi:adenylate kinase
LTEIKTSHIIEQKFSAADAGDPVMAEELRKYKNGELVDSKMIEGWVLEAVADAAEMGKGIIANGWPRKVDEAVIEMESVEKQYGHENIKIVAIQLSEEETLKRNSKRRVCQANGHPVWDTLENADITVCPEDGSPIIVRADDTPETIKKRYQVYLSETAPILDFLKQKGYNVITINGEQSIEDVHREILNRLW